jgi:hypothetical protein
MLPPSTSHRLHQSFALCLLGLSIILSAAAHAKPANQTICCRSSGGTRGSCLNLWTHLVPASSRFAPGASRRIALLLGPADIPTAMTVQLFTATGEPLAEQTLPPLQAGVWLLTLPETERQGLGQPMLWESFPTCQPNKPPTRTLLVPEALPESSATQEQLAALDDSCGKEVAIAPLLRAFGLEDYVARLPASLPVHCQAIRAGSGGAPPSPGNGSRP